MATLYLHIGTHKTGTTALQNALAGLGGFLRAHGWLYLPDLAEAPGLKALYSGREMTMQERAHLHDAARPALDAVRTQNVIISSEMLSGSVGSGYSNGAQFADALSNLWGGVPVKIIVYLRRQDRFFESIYTQRVHQGEALTFDDFRRRCPPEGFLWYEHVLAPYATAFGESNVHAFIYEDLQALGGIIPHFMRAVVGITDPATLRELEEVYDPERTTANHGYTPAALRWATRLNLSLNDEERRALRTMFQSWIRSTKSAFSDYGYFSAHERRTLCDRLRESNLRAMAFCGRTTLPECWQTFESVSSTPAASDDDLELLMRIGVHQASRIVHLERSVADLHRFASAVEGQLSQLSTLIEKLCAVVNAGRFQR